MTVTVNSVNDGPSAVDDVDSVNEDSSVTVDVSVTTQTSMTDWTQLGECDAGRSNGSTSVNPDGTIDYTPTRTSSGLTRSPTRSATCGLCDTATVDITVNSVNDGPNAVDDVDSVDEDSSVTVDVLGNDTDADDGSTRFGEVTAGRSTGRRRSTRTESIDYTPDPDFFGTDSFSYEVCDLAGDCDTATVDITVNRSTTDRMLSMMLTRWMRTRR